jgi:2-methylcitrate dehydratase PrpD
MKVFTAIELKNGAIDSISCFDTQLICDKFVDKWHSIYDIINDNHWEIKTFENETTDMSAIEALDEMIEYIKPAKMKIIMIFLKNNWNKCISIIKGE